MARRPSGTLRRQPLNKKKQVKIQKLRYADQSPNLPKTLDRLEEPPERPKANLNAALAAIEQKTLCNHATAKCRFLI